MTQENKVKIYHLIILDNSISMSHLTMQTIEGVNTQFESMRADVKEFENQEHIACLVMFGHEVKYTIWKKPVSTLEDLTNKTYIANGGSTALCDAIGGGINGLRNEIVEDLKNEDTKVFVSIFTDGQENSSREFTKTDCKELVQEVQETGQWVVTMVGCEENVFEEAESLGISQGNTVKYARSAVGTQVAMSHLSRARHKMSDDLSKGLYDAETTMSYMADTADVSQTSDDSPDLDINMTIDAGNLINKADTETEDNE